MKTSKVFHVARREYGAIVKTWAFLIGVLIPPVVAGAFAVFFPKASRPSLDVWRNASRTAAVVDMSGQLHRQLQAARDTYHLGGTGPKLITTLGRPGEDPAITLDKAHARFDAGGLHMVAAIRQGDAEDPWSMTLLYRQGGEEKEETFTFTSITRDKVSVQAFDVLGAYAWTAIEEEYAAMGVSPAPADADGDSFDFKAAAPVLLVFLIYANIVGMGQHILTSIIEEKSSRIVEVLLSALSPLELMAGKILGLLAVSLTVIAIWLGSIQGAIVYRGVSLDLTPGLLGLFLTYFVLGLLLYVSLLTGIGSLCNNLKEAQGLMMPVMMVVMVPMMLAPRLLQDPAGPLVEGLSYIPLMTPMLMLVRITSAEGVPAMEIVVSLVWLAAWCVVTMLLVAKVFRTGILMYGKRPGPAEILRWLRAK